MLVVVNSEGKIAKLHLQQAPIRTMCRCEIYKLKYPAISADLTSPSMVAAIPSCSVFRKHYQQQQQQQQQQ
ncbi:hypothetical protein E2C01_015961 [Portunus trituberculatus]|uniref:Uncharacterized protein n=1 Tax=Portunus trituberculatus TaxID=210409 RepID=A0A5B7DMU9_PORTR|nr:hypothetical protein [Portunus trituberculatus]